MFKSRKTDKVGYYPTNNHVYVKPAGNEITTTGSGIDKKITFVGHVYSHADTHTNTRHPSHITKKIRVCGEKLRDGVRIELPANLPCFFEGTD